MAVSGNVRGVVYYIPVQWVAAGEEVSENTASIESPS